MRHKILSSLAILLLAAAVGYKSVPSHPGRADAARVAAAYVRTLARNSNARIVGDKVWSVTTKSHVTTVVVRVRYFIVDPFYGPRVGVTTIYVHLVRSGYAVVG